MKDILSFLDMDNHPYLVWVRLLWTRDSQISLKQQQAVLLVFRRVAYVIVCI